MEDRDVERIFEEEGFKHAHIGGYVVGKLNNIMASYVICTESRFAFSI